MVTVRKIINELLEQELEDSYKKYNSWFSRWWNRKKQHKAYVSPNLLERIKEEEELSVESPVLLDGILITDERHLEFKHPKFKFDLVLDIHSNYVVGFNPSYFGLE